MQNLHRPFIDPALVEELVAARHVNDPVGDLSAREAEVLALMAF